MTRADYQEHLARCATDLGVKRTRGHGILDDDTQISKGEGVFNFKNLDKIVDFHQSISMEPLFELSFMPSWLASNASQTTMFYKGGTSPPTDYEKWGDVVYGVVSHLAARYGAETPFMFEVWNEPNGGSFWHGELEAEGGTPEEAEAIRKADYFKLYEATAKAIKNVSSVFQVGGPSTAGCPGWSLDLLEFAAEKDVAVDFVSCHSYGGESDTHAGIVNDIMGGINNENMQTAREGSAKTSLFVTEWSSSWWYETLYHDEPRSAPFIVEAVAAMDGLVDGTSYWTFSDVFEEGGLYANPFHGGFGLLTIDGTPKPAYRAFELLHGAGDQRIGDFEVEGGEGGEGEGCNNTVKLFATGFGEDASAMRLFITNHGSNTTVVPADCPVVVTLDAGVTSASVAFVDEDHCNVKKHWEEEFGSEEYMSSEQLEELEGVSGIVWEEIVVDEKGDLVLTVKGDGLAVIDLK